MLDFYEDDKIFISIHAPTRGATCFHFVFPLFLFNFNPRSHKGSDADAVCPVVLVCDISIHAPTRGATQHKNLAQCTSLFQSTLPQGERRRDKMIIVDFKDISIHAPTRGATETLNLSYPEVFISIHAPTRGATVPIPLKIQVELAFQSTLPQGERLRFPMCLYYLFTISIHAPTRGATVRHLMAQTL